MADNSVVKLLVELETESGKIKKEIAKLTKELEGADMRFAENKRKAEDLARAIAKLTINKRQQIKLNKQLVNSQLELETSTKRLNKAKQASSRATGGATASVLELGRVVSDANYGIRGMANNLSQLATSMAFTFKSSGSLKGGFMALGKAMFGPLGIIVAFNAILSLMERAEMMPKAVAKTMADFSKTVDNSAAKLMTLKAIMSDSNVSLSQKQELINGVNSEFKELNLTLDNQGQLTKEAVKQLNKLTDSMVKNAKARAILEEIAKEQSKIVQIEMEQGERIRQAGVGAFEGTLKDLEERRQTYIKRFMEQLDRQNLTEKQKEDALNKYMESSSMKRFDNLKKYREDDVKDAKKRIRQLQSMITKGGFFSIFDDPKSKGGKSKKLSPFKDPKELEFDIKNQEKALLSLGKQIEAHTLKKQMNDELASAKTEYEKKKIREKYRRLQLESELKFQRKQIELNRDLEISKAKEKEKSYQADLERENTLFKTKVENEFKLGNITKEQRDKLIKDADKKTSKRSKEASERLKTTVESINESYGGVLSTFDKLSKLKLDSLFVSEDGEPLKLKDYLEKAKVLLSGFSQFISANIDRRIAEETNQTNKLNEELNNRLLNENLSKDERARIQNEIWQNDEKLRKKKNELKKKQFNAQKAFNMAQATIETYLSAQKAYASQMAIPTPDAPVRAKIAAAVATAAGLARVAAIASQKFQPEAASTPIRTASGAGGAGGGVGDRSFNFNLVGANQQNQILGAIQSQFDKPIKAYVVSKDITNQQQLDANTKSTARFGG